MIVHFAEIWGVFATMMHGLNPWQLLDREKTIRIHSCCRVWWSGSSVRDRLWLWCFSLFLCCFCPYFCRRCLLRRCSFSSFRWWSWLSSCSWPSRPLRSPTSPPLLSDPRNLRPVHRYMLHCYMHRLWSTLFSVKPFSQSDIFLVIRNSMWSGL